MKRMLYCALGLTMLVAIAVPAKSYAGEPAAPPVPRQEIPPLPPRESLPREQLLPRPHVDVHMILPPTTHDPVCTEPTELKKWGEGAYTYAGCKLPDGNNEGVTYQFEHDRIIKLSNYANGHKEGLEFEFEIGGGGHIFEYHADVRDGMAYSFVDRGVLGSAVTWKNNVRDGLALESMQTAPRASTYVADVRQGVTYTWGEKDDTFTIANFVDGALEGELRTFAATTGELMALETYKRDQLNGLAVAYDVNGLRSAGTYADGKKEGLWFERRPKSAADTERDSTITYVHGAAEGVSRWWYADGLVAEQTIKSGKQVGPFRFWRSGTSWTAPNWSEYDELGAFWQDKKLYTIDANGKRRDISTTTLAWFPLALSVRFEILGGDGPTGVGGAVSAAVPMSRARERRIGGKSPYEERNGFRWEAGVEIAVDGIGPKDSKDGRYLIGPLLRLAVADAPKNNDHELGVVDSVVYLKAAPFLGSEEIGGTKRFMQGVRLGAGLTVPSIEKSISDFDGDPAAMAFVALLFLLPNTFELNAEYAHTSAGTSWRYGISVGYGL
jgi:antitoxin component YwqK of YwqJK toxin-antitoxin module